MKINILKNLPGSNSNDWKEFVQLGLNICEMNNHQNDECPFCHRKFDDNSLELVKAYSVFINDKTEQKLGEKKTVLDSIKNRASLFDVNNEDYYIENNNEINKIIKKIIDDITNGIEIINKNENGLSLIPLTNIDLNELIIKLDNYLNVLKKNMSLLEESSKNKEKALSEYKLEYNKLISDKSISKQISIIEKYFNETENIRLIKKRVSSASSSKITRISNNAHDDLLTANLKNEFERYLKIFEVNNRNIELVKRNTKGKQQTELVMKSGNNVTQILSEGEQKAVSIALFLAEISVAQNESAIIFDDPVNSLDNSMMEKFVNTILELKNQTIIFTHNILFRDFLVTCSSGHCCKNNDSSSCRKTSKHIYCYDVQSEGIYDAGVIIPKEKNNAKQLLDEANDLLSITPFTESDTVCLKLRKAIDHIIDEIVFNKQIPREYSMRKLQQSIQWTELKKMNTNPSIVDDLNRIFNRVSAGQLHLGQVSNTNPPQKSELQQLLQELYNML